MIKKRRLSCALLVMVFIIQSPVITEAHSRELGGFIDGVTPTIAEQETDLLTSGSQTEKPEAAVTEITYSTITFAFSIDTENDGFEVYRSESKTGKFQLLGETDFMYYSDVDLSGNKTYYHKIKGYKAAGTERVYSPFSDIISGKTKILPKPALTLKRLDYRNIEVSYSLIPEADGYLIYRATKNNGIYKLLATTAGDIYVDDTMSFNKVYYYKVKAYKNETNIAGLSSMAYSSFSQTKNIKADLNKPQMLLTKVSYNSRKLSWNKVEGADGYQIARYDNVSRRWKKIKTLGPESVDYSVKSLILSREYRFKVRAYRKIDNKKRSMVPIQRWERPKSNLTNRH